MRVSALYLRISRELEGRRPLSSLNHPDSDPKPTSSPLLVPLKALLSSAKHGWALGTGWLRCGPTRPSQAPSPADACQLLPCQHGLGSAPVSRRREFHIVWKAALPAVGSPKGLESWQHTEKLGPCSSLAFPEPAAWAEGGLSASALGGPGSRGLRLLRVEPVPGFVFRWVSVRPASREEAALRPVLEPTVCLPGGDVPLCRDT